MRVVINEALINRNRKISHILFFISLAGMGAGFFLTWTTDPASGTSQLSCLILPLLLLLTLTSVRMANIWIREPRPVDVLNNALKGLGQKYTIFHHLLPAPHVLIGPEGVFTITTVWQDKSYRVKGKKWYGDEGLLRKLNGYLRQDLIGNPLPRRPCMRARWNVCWPKSRRRPRSKFSPWWSSSTPERRWK